MRRAPLVHPTLPLFSTLNPFVMILIRLTPSRRLFAVVSLIALVAGTDALSARGVAAEAKTKKTAAAEAAGGKGGISTKGVGTWNEESGAENLVSTTAVNYFVRLHIARANEPGEVADYEAALQDLSVKGNRDLIAAKLVTLGFAATANVPLKDIADEVSTSGKTKWQIRVYTDANGTQPIKYFEVSLRRRIEPAELAAARAYLKDHKDPDGKLVLVDRVFADDSAALKVLGMPKGN